MEIRDYDYVIVPNILKNYKCSASGECCKNKWKIDIDEISYDKTKKKLDELNEDIEDYFNKNEEGYVTKFANGYCKFITEEGLCRIHKDFGWECLSDTCKIYPRLLKLSTRGMEMGLVFSCGSSAKLLLTDKKFKIIKVKKEELFFMTPNSVTFIIPENSLTTAVTSRYYELEDFIITILNEAGRLGKKIQYIDKVLKEIYALEDVQTFDFEQVKKEYERYRPQFIDENGVTNLIIKIILAKKEEGSKLVAQEFINLLKLIKLNRDLEKDSVFLRDENFYLELEELYNLKKLWTQKHEKILTNYLSCVVFNKEFYYSREFATMKLIILGTMLKLKILFNKKYLKRELTDEELIYTIKTFENDFSHSLDFFTKFYKENKAEISTDEFNQKLITVLN